MVFMAKYFGTNGARGTIEEFPPSLAKKLARGTARYLGSGKILVARDGRLTSNLYHEAITSGLLEEGCHVIDLGQVTSPTAEFMIKKIKANGLIIITASHNPPEYNGMKVVDGNGIAISKERAERIEELAEKIAETKKSGTIEKYENASEDHMSEIIKNIDVEKVRKRKPRLVLDCGNGMASLLSLIHI